MKFELDPETGRVTADLSWAEFQKVAAALSDQAAAKPAAPEHPKVWVYPVESDSQAGRYYETRIWFDVAGHKHGTCKCKDHTCRGGKWCKHLIRSDAVRRQRIAASLS
jgi:hypothetical protein